MATSQHRILAALFGAVVLTGAAPRADATALGTEAGHAEHSSTFEGFAPESGVRPLRRAERPGMPGPGAVTATGGAPEALPTLPTLGALLESRAKLASDAGRHGEIERLGTLWLTLARRGELDRVVARGEGFVAVALRNQDVSTHRAETRRRRFVATEAEALAALAETSGLARLGSGHGDRADDVAAAEQLLGRLEEPYRTAVDLSLQGMNRREVAERMGVPHATVRKWMQRLRQRLVVEGELAA
jgi:DNA-directed RNA polymerase specialized sigma24 family protein